MEREIKSRKTRIVCILKSFSKYLCWHISYVASKIPSHDTFPNKKESKQNSTSTWQMHSASQAAWLTACISKKKFNREIVCQTQEPMTRLCSLLPGVFINWPDKVLCNSSGFEVSPARTRGWIRQPPGGPLEPRLFCYSLLLRHSQTQLNSAPPASCIRHRRESLWSCRATRNTFLDTPCVKKSLLKITSFHISLSLKFLSITLSNVPGLSCWGADVPLLSTLLQIILVPELGLQQPTFVRD